MTSAVLSFQRLLIIKTPPNLENWKRDRRNSMVMIILKLQEMRKKSRLTQKELSEKSGISISYIRDLEQKGAKRISTEIFDKLCKTLSCNVSDLLEFIDDS